ncbi:hypothetical protein EYC80_003249 [Monilinia laxa]|uniref:Uncharacterized protein n=1 Tax=Monilinia laxa TaxID=61186 RepID=A0A5N6KD44_MONLA|nr:hypothetical protein EYC80_003249 [Monilinia laxa]
MPCCETSLLSSSLNFPSGPSIHPSMNPPCKEKIKNQRKDKAPSRVVSQPANSSSRFSFIPPYQFGSGNIKSAHLPTLHPALSLPSAHH